jgi:hypothetical protein
VNTNTNEYIGPIIVIACPEQVTPMAVHFSLLNMLISSPAYIIYRVIVLVANKRKACFGCIRRVLLLHITVIHM